MLTVDKLLQLPVALLFALRKRFAPLAYDPVLHCL